MKVFPSQNHSVRGIFSDSSVRSIFSDSSVRGIFFCPHEMSPLDPFFCPINQAPLAGELTAHCGFSRPSRRPGEVKFCLIPSVHFSPRQDCPFLFLALALPPLKAVKPRAEKLSMFTRDKNRSLSAGKNPIWPLPFFPCS